MAKTWVKVEGPANRDVFVNQVTEATGETLIPFQVEVGQNTFFLLRDDGEIDKERTQNCKAAPKTDPVIVPLAPLAALSARKSLVAPTAPPRPKTRRKSAAPKSKRRAAGRRR